MKNEITVITKEDNYDLIESNVASAAYMASATADKLLKPDDPDYVPSNEDINSAIDLIHQQISALAVVTKGREVRARAAYLEGQVNKITHSDDDDTITY